MAWSLEGTYFESCNCDTACPCLFLSTPTEGECTALVGWHIEEGSDEGVSLSGLNVALAVRSPGNMATTQWTVAVYVDERATEAQNASLMKIFGGQGGGHPARLAGHIGEIVGVRSVPIDYSIDGGKHVLKIPGIADVAIEQVSGQGGGPVTIEGHPLCIAPGFAATVAKSSKLSFTDHGMAWNLSDKTGVFSPFAYQSEQ
ncbi:DUF1326 domain-containing protein [Breoghania sp. L-A4]|uniref:DUF1326 domain-containing protein n=1 Tax=Breoghania sp. L-A4 TaxID=2304600 RepID=UPI000E35AD8C|nr:DUF1326 domain-containing protein [Breoghania sp. L-A4]AXS41188.1 DUF1326 domain-containing protein [Breoghania sp. L-A4]